MGTRDGLTSSLYCIAGLGSLKYGAVTALAIILPALLYASQQVLIRENERV